MSKSSSRFAKSLIDVHVHLADSHVGDALVPYAKLNRLDYTADEYMGIMKELGIKDALLLSPPMTDGRPLPNQKIIEISKIGKGALHPILTVEPSEADVEGSIRLAGSHTTTVKGFKIRLGYHSVSANDRIFDPLYDFAESARLPVLFHTGDTATPNGALKLSHPMELDELANRRPQLMIVACHFGNPWIEDVAELLYKHQKLYADVSGLFAGVGGYQEQHMKALARRLSEAVYYVGEATKILFGSDYPVSRPDDVIRLVSSMKIKEEDMERIFYKNASGLFRI